MLAYNLLDCMLFRFLQRIFSDQKVGANIKNIWVLTQLTNLFSENGNDSIHQNLKKKYLLKITSTTTCRYFIIGLSLVSFKPLFLPAPLLASFANVKQVNFLKAPIPSYPQKL